ncbi:hypothetical protein EDC01DRAFT_320136 [Geopyxis carbonaria]|nr:hypothetical protein EDC01DRAFT_320136 [Geopyxis carbonaria]
MFSKRISTLLLAMGLALMVILSISAYRFPNVPRDVKNRVGNYWSNSPENPGSRPPPPPPDSDVEGEEDLDDEEPATASSSNLACDVPESDKCYDPYREPGYFWQPKGSYRDSRWIPFTSDLMSAPDPPAATYPADPANMPTFSITPPEEEFLNSPHTPPNLMKDLLTEYKALKAQSTPESVTLAAETPYTGPMAFLQNRRILVLGDSVDRFMVQFFCAELGLDMTQSPVRQSTAACHLPLLNFTLVHWHFSGSYPARPDWWWMPEMEQVAFEDRLPAIWAPTFNTTLGTTRPDLILWQGGLWDQRMFWESGAAAADPALASRERQMAWSETRFAIARLRQFVKLLKETLGADTPMMYRTVTMHRDSSGNDALMYELDRIGRAVGREAGGEVFEWGRLVSGDQWLYMDKTHLSRGEASWLYMNMLLGYLKRAAGEGGWAECNAAYKGWGGR